MIALIRSVFGLFWAVSAGFLGLLAYIVITTEHDPGLLWAWLVMCGLTFISATWLTHTIIFAVGRKPRYHDLHLK